MNILYDLSDWAFHNALWVFLGMVTLVMLIGPWWLRADIRKRSFSISIGRCFWFSFFGGMASIVLFYLMLLAYNFAFNFICAFIGMLAGIGVIETSNTTFYMIYVLIYLVVLQILIRRMVKDTLKKNLPGTPNNTPQIQPENEKHKEILTNSLRWDSGWPLTIMCGACTIIFFFAFTFQLRPRSSVAMYATSLNGIGKALTLYESQYKVFPDDLGNLIPDGLCSKRVLENLADEHESVHQYGEKYVAPKSLHYNKFKPDVPAETLWVWAEPSRYHTNKMPVLGFGGGVAMIKKNELPALIERSKKWLAENPQAVKE